MYPDYLPSGDNVSLSLIRCYHYNFDARDLYREVFQHILRTSQGSENLYNCGKSKQRFLLHFTLIFRDNLE